ncbi:MAG: hypothetical protein EHM31_00430, partial [Candidatus Aminicenantes bacterium]
MNMKKMGLGSIGLAIAAATLLATSDLSEMRSLLLSRTDEAHKAIGIIAGLVDATGPCFTATGATAPGGAVVPDANTV